MHHPLTIWAGERHDEHPARHSGARRLPEMRRHDPLDALAKSPVFGALPATARRTLAGRSRVVTLKPGRRLWNRGGRALHLGLVLSGRLKSVREGSGREVILDVAIPGDILGEVAFGSTAKSYQSTAISLRQAKVLLVPASVLRSMLKHDAHAAAKLSLDLANQLVRMMRRIEALSAVSVEKRLARVLVNLADRTGEPFPGGTLVPLRLRRSDLASLAATTLESVSRRISSWSRDGLLTPQPAGYLIRDLAQLRVIAGED